MSRVASSHPSRAVGPPYAQPQAHFNPPPHAHQPYAQPTASSYAQHPRPRHPPARVPKYTVGTGRSKDGKETETLTLGDSDDEDDAPQAGPSTSSYQHPTSSYPSGQQANGNGYGAGDGRSGGGNKRRADGGQGAAQGGAGASKRKRPNDPYGGYDQNQKVPVTDKEGHYIFNPKVDIVDPKGTRYRVSRQLGMGTFGKVMKAYVAKSDGSERPVAVKVIRAVDKYREAAKVEIRVLEAIVRIDKQRGEKYDFRFNHDSQCIHLDKWFMFRGHTCLVTELLGCSVFDFLKSNSYKPFSFREIQSFARQMLDSIGCLHKNGITHTDLKPENILLVNDDADTTTLPNNKPVKRLRSTEIRLIDFGSATLDNEYHATVVSTRHYRAPEIILGLGWEHPCDIWSIGCILVEFFTGEALFQTHENLEHLAMMEKVFGAMPTDYADEAYKKNEKSEKEKVPKDKFFRNGSNGHKKLNFPAKVSSAMKSAEKNSVQFVLKMKKLEAIIQSDEDPATADKFLDLIKNLLQWDVNKRWSAEVALDSAFCKARIP